MTQLTFILFKQPLIIREIAGDLTNKQIGQNYKEIMIIAHNVISWCFWRRIHPSSLAK